MTLRLHAAACVRLLVRALLAVGLCSAGKAALTRSLEASADALVFEAELCPSLGYPWRPVRAKGASGGLALSVPEGAGSDEAFDSGKSGRAVFTIPAAGGPTREVWLRVFWNGNCSNSVYVMRDGAGRGQAVTSHTMQAWHWLKVRGLRIPPEGGNLLVRNREDGVLIDQICIAAEGSPAPFGVLPAAATWPAPERSLPPASLMLCPGGAEVEALPPTEYLLHHRRAARLSMPVEPVLPVFPSRPTPLDVWLRWNRHSGLPAEIAIDAPAELAVTPSGRLPLPTAAAPLTTVSFSVRARPGLPRGLSRMTCRLRTAEGLEQVRELRVLRPYRWLVSQAFRLNPDAGLDQLAALDAAVLAAPLEAGHGVQWQEVEPKHFTAFGLLNLRQAVSAQPFVQAYAFTRVRHPGGAAVLDLTHDDWLRVWVNGACVFSSQESSPSTLTRTRVKVTLRPGDNAVLVRCAQLKNYWEFGLVAEVAAEDEDEEETEATEATAQPAAAVASPAAFSPAPLPAWAFESIAEEMAVLTEAQAPGERWRVLAAACRDCPLSPLASWLQLVSRAIDRLRSAPGGPEEALRGAEALLDLRRRVECALSVPEADARALMTLTFRERARLLEAAGRPLEAAEETMGAICWAAEDSRNASRRQGHHADIVRLFLSGDALEEALAYVEGPAATLPQAKELQAVVALYRGDTAAARALLPQHLAATAAGQYAEWLLRTGRAREAEWLLGRVQEPSLANRMALSTACIDQRRFAEGEAVLRECVLHQGVQRHEWESAAAAFAKFHSARCSIPAAVAGIEAELGRLSPQREEHRLRWLNVLVRLHQEAEEPVATLAAALAEADETAQRYRQQPTTAEGALRPAMARLWDEGRYGEMISLCNHTVTVSPGLRLATDVYRLQALLALGRQDAAEAVLARLATAAETDALRARNVLSLLMVSKTTAAAARRLALAALEHHPKDRRASGDARLALAYADAAQGQYADSVQGLEQALGHQAETGRSAEILAGVARYWVARCLDLAGDAPELKAVLLASPDDLLRQAADDELHRRAQPLSVGIEPGGDEEEERASRDPLDHLLVLLGAMAARPEAEASVLEALGEAGRSRLAIERGDRLRVWVLPPTGAPVCFSLGDAPRMDRFPNAFRAWSETPPVTRAIAFLDGLVWVAADTGLYCYRRDWDCWDRLRWPDEADGDTVAALDVDDGCLRVTVRDAEGREASRRFDLAAWVWAEPAVP